MSGGQVGDSLVSEELEPTQGTGQSHTQEIVVLDGGSQSTEQSRPQGLKWASERSEMFRPENQLQFWTHLAGAASHGI